MGSGPTVAMAPGALPGLGHLARFTRSPLAFLRGLPAHGDLVGIRLGGQHLVMVCDPELTRALLLDDRAFDKGGALYDRLRDVGGNGVATCPASEHRRQRRLLQPLFRRELLPGYARIMTDRVGAVAGGWRDHELIDLSDEVRRITADVVVSTLFGADLDRSTHAWLSADLRTLTDGTLRRTVLPEPLRRLPLPANLRFQRASVRSRRIMTELIEGFRGKEIHGGHGLVPMMLSACDPDGEEAFSDAELVDQAITFYNGGTETTAWAVCWAIHLSSLHPVIRARLTDEARTVLGGRLATWEDLPRLGYTRQTFTEALRLRPPAWFLTRRATADTRLGDHVIPEGTTLAYSPYLMGQLPAHHPDPESFDPDRWCPRTDRTTPAPPPVTAFGGGARKCMGEEFAWVEGVLLLAGLVSRWDIRIEHSGVAIPRRPQLTLNPGRLRARVVRQPWVARSEEGRAERP
ncbi:cytochrome P450 [Streptomyces sp. NPDC000594]|uniref:cytochrome P450 n=1 Tax=Streptomyces sp. NPDC000594 TaxID=3154261 RepID=UPI00331C8EDC